jgi:hypothetical protein
MGGMLRRANRIIVRDQADEDSTILYESKNKSDLEALRKAVSDANLEFLPPVHNCIDSSVIHLYAGEKKIGEIPVSGHELRGFYSSVDLHRADSETIIRWFNERNIKLPLQD